MVSLCHDACRDILECGALDREKLRDGQATGRCGDGSGRGSGRYGSLKHQLESRPGACAGKTLQEIENHFAISVGHTHSDKVSAQGLMLSQIVLGVFRIFHLQAENLLTYEVLRAEVNMIEEGV